MLSSHRAAAVLCLAASACAKSAAPSPALSAKAAEPPNEPVPEATVENAGAARCRLGAPLDIGAARKDGRYTLGFGTRGGLAAWSSPRGLLVRPLTATLSPAGDEVVLPIPADAQPDEVVPAGRGFVVIATRLRRKKTLCEAECSTAFCPPGSQAHVCTVPCSRPCELTDGTDVLLAQTDHTGRALGEPVTLPSARVQVEAVIQGEPRSFGFVTSKALVLVHVRSDGIETTTTKLPTGDFVLPARGAGPASALILSQDGRAQVVDAGGVRSVNGNLLDEHAGQILDARFQARWGPDGKIHVARQAWLIAKDAIRYATIVEGDLRFDGPAERGFRAPFAEYVEPRSEGGRWKRGSWLQRNVGEDIDLRAADPEAGVGSAFWTGTAFAFSYRVERSGGSVLRAIKADCSG